MQVKVWHVQGSSALQTIHDDVIDQYVEDGAYTVQQEEQTTIYSLRFLQRAKVVSDGLTNE